MCQHAAAAEHIVGHFSALHVIFFHILFKLRMQVGGFFFHFIMEKHMRADI